MISVIVFTLNEEQNLPACLASLSWSDDIVVFDSYSTDSTVAIARQHGARVVQRRFDNESAHQNWAVENIDFKHRWVYYSDADEIVTPALRDEMNGIAHCAGRSEVAFRVRFKNQFMGKWLRWSSLYPTWVLRLFQPACVRWERLINTVPVVRGPVGRLQSHFLHFSFNKGIEHWIHKHNRYSSQEALEAIQSQTSRRANAMAVFSLDPVARRKAAKELAWRIPFRPTARFIYMYVLRLGFLDGGPGLRYCQLLAMYEFMIDMKIREIRREEQLLKLE